MATLFERILAGEIPAQKIYEDDKVFAILDINPVQKGHVLLITKFPYRWIQDCDDETLAHAFVVVKKIIHHMKETLGCDYVNVVIEGLEVPHMHIKLIPSMASVKNAEWHHSEYEEGEMEQYAQKLQMQ